MKPDRVRKQVRHRAPRAGAPHSVRIIGGQWKRTPLPVAGAPGLRPTPDRVRETLFNWLVHLRSDLAALRGLDAFAGTGALGFELASRGAKHVTLIERDTGLAAGLRELAAKLGAGGIQIVTGDALAVMRRLPPAAFDLVFIDPPFDARLHAPALDVCVPLLAPGGLVYLEAPNEWGEAQLAPRGWQRVRHARAGQVHAHLLVHLPAG